MKALLIILSISTFSLIQQKEDWPQKEKEAFIKNCVKNAKVNMGEKKAESYCSCMLDKIIEKYPTPEGALKMTAEDAQKMAVNCQ